MANLINIVLTIRGSSVILFVDFGTWFQNLITWQLWLLSLGCRRVPLILLGIAKWNTVAA